MSREFYDRDEWRCCSVTGCRRQEHAKGLCVSHYNTQRRTGTTEPSRCEAVVLPLKENKARPCGAVTMREINGRPFCQRHAKSSGVSHGR